MTKTKTEVKNLPAYRIFSVTKISDDKSAWFEVGSAWKHKDGKGFSLQFKAIPLPGAEVVLREPKSKDDAEK